MITSLLTTCLLIRKNYNDKSDVYEFHNLNNKEEHKILHLHTFKLDNYRSGVLPRIAYQRGDNSN